MKYGESKIPQITRKSMFFEKSKKSINFWYKTNSK